MITKLPFGRTGHQSTRVIFGGYALSEADEEDADQVLTLLKEFGVNHIDTAPLYGNSEELIGNWMLKHRTDFFLGTKTRNRMAKAASEQLQQSLDKLNVESIDLWQMHGLTNPQGWEKAMGKGGVLEAFVEAKETGLVKHLGVTGHGSKVPKVHLKSIEFYEFDSVLLPYNFEMLQNPKYSEPFFDLISKCHERNIAVQTIKSAARRPWDAQPRNYNTYFYQPLVDQEAIDTAIHWAMGLENSFVISAGDMELLPKILQAASNYFLPPSEEVMKALMEKYEMRKIFSY